MSRPFLVGLAGLVGLLLGVLPACSTSATRPEVAASHPAHPGASEASYSSGVEDWTSSDFGSIDPDSFEGYACPMQGEHGGHGEPRSETPGQCVECGMDFVPWFHIEAP